MVVEVSNTLVTGTAVLRLGSPETTHTPSEVKYYNTQNAMQHARLNLFQMLDEQQRVMGGFQSQETSD